MRFIAMKIQNNLLVLEKNFATSSLALLLAQIWDSPLEHKASWKEPLIIAELKALVSKK
jgi:hypothetical protein